MRSAVTSWIIECGGRGLETSHVASTYGLWLPYKFRYIRSKTLDLPEEEAEN